MDRKPYSIESLVSWIALIIACVALAMAWNNRTTSQALNQQPTIDSQTQLTVGEFTTAIQNSLENIEVQLDQEVIDRDAVAAELANLRQDVRVQIVETDEESNQYLRELEQQLVQIEAQVLDETVDIQESINELIADIRENLGI